ncbi:cytochrome c-type biogenesis protein CcsB [Verrucomicrobium sp. GAS474]|uniref:cytochrome c biogenesis protein n=1 Tax=Verrucomicrobium sp. GAS474 TaxID=1882831 RepID=UPI00087BD7C2|nr:cytochrome c biogenesis protein CcsA [Verrucomicrobium sp. GAS474]SDU17218.1 cytochrome c-type biogenesis protein CcsB [Verrucomicrobium sp. GAS474]
MKRLLLLLLLALALIVGLHDADAAGAAPELKFDSLSQVAIQDQSRKKPLTTFTREATLQLTGRTSVLLEDEHRTLSADAFILTLWLNSEGWDEKPLLLVDYLPLRKALGLPAEKKRFTYRELAGNAALQTLLADGGRMKPTLNPAGGNDGAPRLQKAAEDVAARLHLFEAIATGRAFTLLPSPPHAENGAWHVLTDIVSLYPKETCLDVLLPFRDFVDAWKGGKQKELDDASVRLARSLRSLNPAAYPTSAKLSLEAAYLRLHPWRWAWICYGAAVLAFLLTARWFPQGGYRAGWALALAGFACQLFGFVCRILIAGRPPVTNMYESIIWVSFAVVLFALILEAVHRSRVFLAAGTPLAVLALMAVDFQPLAFDASIQPLTPVLRNNFWLAIHVMTITLSYGAFALAMALGHVTLFRSLRGKLALKNDAITLYVYRALQIGVLLLAAGTILGGVWANYSWGRFWDWDPKETWALITLLGYLAVLHGRIAKWWGDFGLAVGAIVGFLSVVMAWYGVNFVLGKGLHSYGFGTGGTTWAVIYAVIEIAFVAVVLRQRKKA